APREASSATGVNGNQADNSAPDAGAAYVFFRSGTTWSQEAYLKASNTDAGDGFGGNPNNTQVNSVAISGDTVIVGALLEASSSTGVNGNEADNSAPSSGAAYVFVGDGMGNWSQQAYLKASNTDAADVFGYSVAVSGDTVVVGAIGEASESTLTDAPLSPPAPCCSSIPLLPCGWDGAYCDSGPWCPPGTDCRTPQLDNSAPASGAAYVFFRSGTTWSQEAYLKAWNTDAGDSFGHSVGISGDTVVVGAPFEDSFVPGGFQIDPFNPCQVDDNLMGAPNSGAAYIFTRSGGVWDSQWYLKAANTGSNDQFGRSVAVSGDTVVVGAPFECSDHFGVITSGECDQGKGNNCAQFSGAAYVFNISIQQAYLKASNTDAVDFFGTSVAVSGDTWVVGAYLEASNATGVNGDQADNSAPGAGAAYVFTDPVNCPAGLTDCAGICVDLDSDEANCGTCGIPCNAGEICSGGACTSDCPAGLTDCAGICVDLDSDEANCGNCGIPCDAGEICSGSACTLNCQAGLTDCAGICVDLDSDEANCGFCGDACTPGSLCLNGACLPLGDLDLDCDVDLFDHSLFAVELTGPGPGCP
ncbi:MAG: MXAN_6577-like cysteine-rich protein, partial [Planctomycetota bacterium]